MKIFNTADLDERMMKTLSSSQAAYIYNGLDCCVTAEIYNELMDQLETEPENVRETYENTLAKLAPIMEMSMRGTYIDEEARQGTIDYFEKMLDKLDQKFQRIMVEVFDGPRNWNSHTQMKGLFYTTLGIKEIRKRNDKGQWVATINKEALEYFDRYLMARPLAKFVLLMRDIRTQISFLKTEIDHDQRIRATYNLAGTNSGRLACSMSEFGTGTNLQNVNRKLRYPFISDPGMYMVNIDLEQADSRNVGAICWELFFDEYGPEYAGSYLDACESSDLHTTVAQMVWPELAWPSNESAWKKFCDGLIAHGQDSYRQLAKKGGHGTNYYGLPRTMARHLHTSTSAMKDFQHRYFSQFPCIGRPHIKGSKPLAGPSDNWHDWVINEIKTTGTITTLFGRRRMFWGRANDASTHRKAIAYAPQSMTGEEIDRGLLRVWRKYPQVQLLNQVHDSILLQLPFSEATELIPLVLRTMKIVLELKGDRKFTVPLEASGGWNWGYAHAWAVADYEAGRCRQDQIGNLRSNIYGLTKWIGKENRDRPNPKRRLKDYLLIDQIS